jgi:AcrR family transcriptional regulator
MVGDVNSPSPGKRRYESQQRAERAAATRRAVLGAARELFVRQGYTATTVADIARAAGVAPDTVYATVGRKPALLRELVETSISGTDQAVPAEQRDYVIRVQAAHGARAKLEIYASAIAEIQQRMGPVFLALRDAAATDPDCAALWSEISHRRATNMRRFAADLRSTGELREDLSDEQVADVIWSMNAAEYWALLVSERGWAPSDFAAWLSDAWPRLLLRPADAPTRQGSLEPGGQSPGSG